jgi:hypothetical protein
MTYLQSSLLLFDRTSLTLTAFHFLSFGLNSSARCQCKNRPTLDALMANMRRQHGRLVLEEHERRRDIGSQSDLSKPKHRIPKLLMKGKS